MRLIDSDTLKAEFTGNFHEIWHYTGVRATIDNAPTIDAVPVVRCKDCKHAGEKHCQLVGGLTHIRPYDFCSYGERKDTACDECDLTRYTE